MQLVLLVHSNGDDRRKLGGWLEAAGYSLMDCPGPKREDFSCLGIRGRRCALVEIADLVILDGRVLEEAGGENEGVRKLLHYYLGCGKPILVLLDRIDGGIAFENDRVATADRSDREAILRAARDLLDVECLAS